MKLSTLKDPFISGSINLERKRLLEALFELISSEASYLKSLNVLISHFVQSPKLLSADPAVIRYICLQYYKNII